MPIATSEEQIPLSFIAVMAIALRRLKYSEILLLIRERFHANRMKHAWLLDVCSFTGGRSLPD